MDGLGLVTDLREDEWALVVSEVEKAGGVRQVSGMARVEIELAVTKARTLVDKARQPQDPKPTPIVPAKRKKQIIYTDGRRYSRAQMPLGANPSNYPTDKYELVNPDGTPFKKAVEPVAKHPGHASQASHGGKGGGGQKSQSDRGSSDVRTAKNKASAHQEIESITSQLAFARSNGDKEVVGMLEERRAGARQAYKERFGEAHQAGTEPSGSTAGDAGVAQSAKILSNAKDGAMYHDAGSIAQEQAMMGKTTKSDAIGRAHKHDQDFAVSMRDSNAYAERATAIRRAQPNNPKAEKMAQAHDRDSRKFQTEAAISMSLASAWTSVAMDLGASESDLISNNRL